MKKQKTEKKPRSLRQKAAVFLLRTGGVALLGASIYLLYSLAIFWQLERRSAELPGLHLYSVQESNYTNAFSWYASYPKIDEPAFDTAAAKIANDAKGAFLAKVNFDAKTNYPHDDLNVSYSVDSYDDKKLSVTLTSRRVVKNDMSYTAKKLSYDRQRQKVLSITDEKEPEQPKDERVIMGKIPQAHDSGCEKQKCVALTFNDGPSPVTPQILDTLKANSAKATFFETGAQANLYPSVAKRTVKEGHVIGSLGFGHLNMTAVPFGVLARDINRGEGAIVKAAGVRPGLLRAAYGAMTEDLAKKLAAPVIGWNIDPKDNTGQRDEIIYRNVMSKIRPGAVVVSRDTRQATADAYARIIPDLSKKGYKLVTVPQLLGFTGSEKPGVYAN